MNTSATVRFSSKPSSTQARVRRRLPLSSLLASIVVLLASGGVFAYLVAGKHISTLLEPDVFKQTYQFLLIVVVGGAVSLLYKEFSDERSRDQDRRNILRKTHSDLLDVFNTVKLVRRTLRARIGYTHDIEAFRNRIVKGNDYREQMEILVVSQLKFEVYSKQATEQELFFAKGDELRSQYEVIEKYLRAILSEYEINLIDFAEPPSGKKLSDLPRLGEFIGPFKKDMDFDIKFKQPFRSALSALPKAGLT